jgi:hypothetical protein
VGAVECRDDPGWSGEEGPEIALSVSFSADGKFLGVGVGNLSEVAKLLISLLESTSVSSAKLNTPESDGFIADANVSFGEQILDIRIA